MLSVRINVGTWRPDIPWIFNTEVLSVGMTSDTDAEIKKQQIHPKFSSVVLFHRACRQYWQQTQSQQSHVENNHWTGNVQGYVASALTDFMVMHYAGAETRDRDEGCIGHRSVIIVACFQDPILQVELRVFKFSTRQVSTHKDFPFACVRMYTRKGMMRLCMVVVNEDNIWNQR